jgi:hypothetical protein
MNQYHIDARQRCKLAAVSDRAATNRTVRPCGEPPSCPHHRSSAQVSKEDAAAVGRTAERGPDSSNAICGTSSWIIAIIHELEGKVLSHSIIGWPNRHCDVLIVLWKGVPSRRNRASSFVSRLAGRDATTAHAGATERHVVTRLLAGKTPPRVEALRAEVKTMCRRYPVPGIS